MKRLFRIFFVILLALGILIVIAAVAVSLFANNALKVAVESAGTKALNVRVKIDDVDLSIFKGRVGLENLTISNPPGYQYDNLLELNRATILLNVKTLLDDTVNITDIKMDEGNIVLEQKGVSGNNLQDIVEQLPDEETSTGKRLHVDTIEIANAVVKVKLLPVPGKVDTLSFKLSPIKLTDLGGENSFDSVALTRTILLAVAGRIAKQGAGILPDEMLGSLVTELVKLGALPRVLLEEGLKMLKAGTDMGAGTGKGVGEEIIKGAEEIGKGITEGVKVLLGQKEKEED